MKNLFVLFLLAFLTACASPPEADLSHVKSETMAYGGLERHYLISDPRPSERKKPMVIALHGWLGTPEGLARIVYGRFEELSRQEGFIVVYPSGAVGKSWNDGFAEPRLEAEKQNIDDSGFLVALIDKMVTEHGADPSRVYMAGISNGGGMTYRFACEHPDKVRAIAAFVSTIDEVKAKNCAHSTPLPVLIVNSTEDPIVPWDGQFKKFASGQKFKVLSVPELMTFWSQHNGCKKVTAPTALPEKDPDDGTYLTLQQASDCTGDSEVTLYGVHGAGHTWPSGWQYLPEMFIGKTTHEISGVDLAWSFFKKHP